MPVTIQPIKEDGQTIQTVPVSSKEISIPTRTKTLTETLPNSSVITKIILETAEIPAEPTISSQSQNSVKLWFSKNDKMIIGISCGVLFLMITAAVFFQIRKNKASRREQNQAITSPKTPKTPETPRGKWERRMARGEIRTWNG